MKNKFKIFTIFFSILTGLSPLNAYAQFSDLPPEHYNFVAISYLENQGLVKGYEDNTFRPNIPVNRVEFLAFIIKAKNIPLDINLPTPFIDLDAGAWYMPYVQKAYSEGWINGYEDFTFRPGNKINKAEAMKILGKAYRWQITSTEVLDPFIDVPVASWFGPYVDYAKKANFLEEKDEYYLPSEPVTRAKISEILYRVVAYDTGFEPLIASNSGSIKNDIPFTAQAPFGEWGDVRQAEACEETAVFMAVKWFRGESYTSTDAKNEIIAMYNHQVTKYWTAHDTSAADTLNWIAKDYFHYDNAFLKANVNADDVIYELSQGRLVIAMVNGKVLANPNFGGSGPLQHAILIIGYDKATENFLVHDPGTRAGSNYKYSKKTIDDALYDYETGDKTYLPERTKRIIVIGPQA